MKKEKTPEKRRIRVIFLDLADQIMVRQALDYDTSSMTFIYGLYYNVF